MEELFDSTKVLVITKVTLQGHAQHVMSTRCLVCPSCAFPLANLPCVHVLKSGYSIHLAKQHPIIWVTIMKLSKILMGFVLQDGWRPLHMASQQGHLDVVKTLIEAGANINQVDKVSTYTYISKPVISMYLYKCDQGTQRAGRRGV